MQKNVDQFLTIYAPLQERKNTKALAASVVMDAVRLHIRCASLSEGDLISDGNFEITNEIPYIFLC